VEAIAFVYHWSQTDIENLDLDDFDRWHSSALTRLSG
tara:strand:+ start:3306 stop:3416 length:111 start_codon:yes stop_codon:yes gene_type:complete